MKLKFQKYHGAGNDFIIISESDLKLLSTEFIRKLCSRKTGIGADGLIAISKPEPKNKTARFSYFNADGKEADFCGNGLRCAAMFCYRNFNLNDIKFETKTGSLQTKIIKEKKVSIEVPVNRQPEKIKFGKKTLFFCNTGVPHAIQLVKNINNVNVSKEGKKIRFHKIFHPEGTNANFAEILSNNSFRLRTYERGVEAETEACGSGAAAAALSLAIFANLSFPIKVLTKSNYALRLDKPKVKNSDKISKLILIGPAEQSFSGEITLG